MCVLDTDVAIHFITQYICDLFPLFEIQQKKEIISEKKKSSLLSVREATGGTALPGLKVLCLFGRSLLKLTVSFRGSRCFKVLKAPCLVSRFPICFGGYPFDSCWRV